MQTNKTNQVLDLFHIGGGGFYKLTFDQIQEQVNIPRNELIDLLIELENTYLDYNGVVYEPNEEMMINYYER